MNKKLIAAAAAAAAAVTLGLAPSASAEPQECTGVAADTIHIAHEVAEENAVPGAEDLHGAECQVAPYDPTSPEFDPLP